MSQNVRIYPWYRFTTNLIFWQAVWFLFFQQELTHADAILLYAVYDIATMFFEVPSGYLSDRIGRRFTLVLAGLAQVAGLMLLVIGGDFLVFAAAQICLGASAAMASGTDSAMLYESLKADGRAAEIEKHELRAWRAAFLALALSAVSGGLVATEDMSWPFVGSLLASLVSVVLVLRFREPGNHNISPKLTKLPTLPWTEMMAHPALVWFLCLSLFMYLFSHVPFVFGQPFILDALARQGLAANAPAVSGAVTATMMIVSVGFSLLAPKIKSILGLAQTMLVALGIQVLLIGMLALSTDLPVIGKLLLRMVPDSLSRPFILARIQPLLPDVRRATYLSVQSFLGRLFLAVSLIVLSPKTDDGDLLSHAEMKDILIWYVAAGLLVLVGLAVTARAIRDEHGQA